MSTLGQAQPVLASLCVTSALPIHSLRACRTQAAMKDAEGRRLSVQVHLSLGPSQHVAVQRAVERPRRKPGVADESNN